MTSAVTRPFRYNLNLIPYDYTVEETNRFKGLALPEELWTKVHKTVQVTRTIPKKKEMQKGKIGCLRRPYN